MPVTRSVGREIALTTGVPDLALPRAETTRPASVTVAGLRR